MTRVAVALLAALLVAFAPAQGEPVPIYFFWGDGCPHCAAQKVFLRGLERDANVIIHDFEVYYVAENRPLFEAMAAAFGGGVAGVPTTFIGDETWVGFSDAIGRQMRDAVARYGAYDAPDPADRLPDALRERFFPQAPPPAPPSDAAGGGIGIIELPLLGAIDVAHRGLLASTALIAFVDGVNPCSLWVLALLLAVVVNTRSRRRVLLVGLTFLLVTASVYGLFIAGLFSVLAVLPLLAWLRIAVAAIAAAFALVHLKDYFAYRVGFTLSTPDAAKPGIYRHLRGLREDRPLPATLAATAGMAFGVTLVELPCTAGLPMLWSTLLADAAVASTTFAALLGVYMLVYLLDELAIFAVVVVTMRVSRVQERTGRILKLVGGSIMLALAVAMIVAPAALQSLTGTLVVFGAAFAAAIAVAALHHVVHPASSPWRPASG
jgi:glutaredoxin